MSPAPSPPHVIAEEPRLAERIGFIQPLSTMIDPQSRQALTSMLKWVSMARLVTATLLLGSAIGLQVKAGEMSPMITALDVLTIGMYAFSVLCVWLMFRIRRLTAFALFQFFVDTLFVTALIYVTGAAESVFSFLYFINIISSAYVLLAPGAVFTATLSSLTYVAVLGATHAGFIPHFRLPEVEAIERSYFLYNLTVNVFAYYLVAFLSSYLSGQLRQAGAALRQGQGQFRQMQALKNRIVENVGSGVVTVDQGGLITSANGAAEGITGAAATQLLGTPLEEFIPQVKPLLYGHADRSPVAPGTWECSYERSDGSQLILGFKASPLRTDQGDEIGKILIIDDLTHIRAMEERMRRDERLATVGRLAAGIAHEIRNPLASISGSIQVLQSMGEAGEEESRLMEIAVRETDRLNGLLTDFLQYVRQVPLQRGPIDLGSLIRETLSAIKRDPRAHEGVEIRVDFRHKQAVSGDPNQLRQVMWNLILNAVDAVGARGFIEIRTRDLVADSTGGPPRVELVVRDSGAGIAEAHAARIFDPFFSTKTKGTGLGLAMVEKIIQAHDGTIVARNSPAGGAEFIIVLQGHVEGDLGASAPTASREEMPL